MSSVVISGNTSGTVTLFAPDVSGNTTLTLPTTSGTVALNGPAFSAYIGTNQSITSSSWTKVAFATKVFDTNTNYDTTLYRFTPTIAGYYQVCVQISSATTTTVSGAAIYKNGSALHQGVVTAGNSAYFISGLVYCNGSTDYIEGYGYLTGISPQIYGTSNNTYGYFQASLVRGA